MWRFVHRIVAAGDTFTWDPDTPEDVARALWFPNPPGRSVVAVDSDGAVVGAAAWYPNQRGPGAHIAGANFMVDPDRSGRGAGRALCEYVLEGARADGYRAMQFNAVAETNVAAVRLYGSLGFEVLTTVPEAFEHPVHGLVGLHVMFRRL